MPTRNEPNRKPEPVGDPQPGKPEWNPEPVGDPKPDLPVPDSNQRSKPTSWAITASKKVDDLSRHQSKHDTDPKHDPKHDPKQNAREKTSDKAKPDPHQPQGGKPMPGEGRK